MILALTTEYAWGPKELESMVKKGLKCDGYSLMKSLENNFKIKNYELTCWIPEEGIMGIKRYLSKHKNTEIVSVHAYAPLKKDFILGEHPSDRYNISSINENKRERALNALKETVRLTSDLGAKYVVVHGGVEEERNKNLNNLLKSVEETIEFIKKNNFDIKIGVENGLYPHDIFISKEEIEKISKFYPYSGLWFDIGHAFVNPSSDPLKIIESCKDYVIGFHLHNNNLKKDIHNSLNKGNIDIEFILNEFKKKIKKENIPLVLEIYSYRANPSNQDVIDSINLVKNIIDEKI